MKNRRSFIQKMAAGVSAAVLAPVAVQASPAVGLSGALIHHVFFWLKEPGNLQHRKQFEAALKKLLGVKTIRISHIGIPASTEQRDVVDHTYTYSLMTVFDSKADQESYQVDPIHQAFVTENSHLWNKVVVYDSVDV
ncbi:MAG TPA: Dabb family protein [Prolixibacteraceae bacterium]|nr:Dabb family protein [Prolixibacteraceae bacterium]